MRSRKILSHRLLWPFSTLCLSLGIFIRNPLIGGCFLELGTCLYFQERNACCLPRMVIVKKIISFHELTFVKLLISKRQSTQIDSFKHWRFEYFSFCPFDVWIKFLLLFKFNVWLYSVFVAFGAIFEPFKCLRVLAILYIISE